jgi:hypothetical protein
MADHGRTVMLSETLAHAAADVVEPGRAGGPVQVGVAVVGERPDARLVVFPADPGRRWRQRWHGVDGGGEPDQAGERFGEQARRVRRRRKLDATWHQHLGRDHRRSDDVRPDERFRAGEASLPEVALGSYAGVQPLRGRARLDNYLAPIRQRQARHRRQVPGLEHDASGRGPEPAPAPVVEPVGRYVVFCHGVSVGTARAATPTA